MPKYRFIFSLSPFSFDVLLINWQILPKMMQIPLFACIFQEWKAWSSHLLWWGIIEIPSIFLRSPFCGDIQLSKFGLLRFGRFCQGEDSSEISASWCLSTQIFVSRSCFHVCHKWTVIFHHFCLVVHWCSFDHNPLFPPCTLVPFDYFCLLSCVVLNSDCNTQLLYCLLHSHQFYFLILIDIHPIIINWNAR